MPRIAFPLLLALSTLALLAPGEAQIYLDAETPATGSLLGSSPLVTAFGTVTFVGEFRAGPSDPEFIAAGAANNIFDTAGSSPSTATFTFDFDVNEITFIYGGNGGSILLEARDIGGGVVDSLYQASTGASQPAGPVTFTGGGIRELYWEDTGGSFAPIDNVTLDVGLNCTIAGPVGTGSGDIQLDLVSSSPTALTVDVDFEYSIDAGVSWTSCTPAGTSPLGNPALTVPIGAATFLWDSLADAVGTTMVAVGVLARATVDDGVIATPPTCETAAFDVDNVPLAPTCTLTGPVGLATGPVTVTLDATSINSPTVEVDFEYSLDGGATWAACTALATSPLANPALAVAPGPATFIWDGRADGAGTVAVAPGVLVQALLDDGVSPLTGTCTTAPFDLDNTALCSGICGDCDLGGSGPNILDALAAAQIAAGLVTPTLEQEGCCDVDASMAVGILDALRIAQTAAGLPTVLTCP